MQHTIIQRIFKDKKIFFDFIENELYLNATKTAKEFGKRLDSWKKSPQTIEYINVLSAYTNRDNGDLMKVIFGGNDKNVQGTWLHPKLIIPFSRWLSAEFSVWCDLTIEDILSQRFAPKISLKEKLELE
ncbi:KilA-N domain-containing protein, partial [Thiovulum sp. ES]